MTTQKTTTSYWYKVGYAYGIKNSCTNDFQEFCLDLQSRIGTTLSGSSPERSEGGPAKLIWDGFHRGRNA